MATVSFNLIHKKSGHSNKECSTLIDMYIHIQKHLNNPRNWMVEELEDGDAVDQCCAFYLLENFTKETLPPCIQDIN